jgi:hypothetical protein
MQGGPARAIVPQGLYGEARMACHLRPQPFDAQQLNSLPKYVLQVIRKALRHALPEPRIGAVEVNRRASSAQNMPVVRYVAIVRGVPGLGADNKYWSRSTSGVCLRLRQCRRAGRSAGTGGAGDGQDLCPNWTGGGVVQLLRSTQQPQEPKHLSAVRLADIPRTAHRAAISPSGRRGFRNGLSLG